MLQENFVRVKASSVRTKFSVHENKKLLVFRTKNRWFSYFCVPKIRQSKREHKTIGFSLSIARASGFLLLSQQRLTARRGDLYSVFSIFSQNSSKNTDKQILQNYIPHHYRYWVGSGREGIRQVLSQSGVKRVALPAYTCQVVLNAVKAAGCIPIFYNSGVVADIKDIRKIIKKADALILAYNFGFLPEIEPIAALCRKQKVLLIEDCAQALGATSNGRLAGSFGDYAIYSFGLSKNVGFCGGMVASPKPFSLLPVKKYPWRELAKTIAVIMASPLLFNKFCYRFFYPFLRVHLHHQPTPLAYFCPALARKIILRQFERYDKILKQRQMNGEYCSRELNSIVPFISATGGNPSWLYFVILSDDVPRLRQRLLRKGVDLGPMRTFRALRHNCPKALDAERKVLTFALYRPISEVRYLVSTLNAIYSHGNKRT